jgi:hypothetical protein
MKDAPRNLFAVVVASAFAGLLWFGLQLDPLVASGPVAAVPTWQDPDVGIDGPETARAGDLVILSARVDGAESFAWLLANSDKSYLPVEGGRRLVFASGTPGPYVFVLAVSVLNDPADAVQTRIVKHVVTIEGGQPPNPNPDPDGPDPEPDNPDPDEPEPEPGPGPDLSPLAGRAFDALRGCDYSAVEAIAAAANMQTTASRAAGLANMSVAEINDDLRTRNRRDPFNSDEIRERWAPFFAWYTTEMATRQDRDAAIEALQDIGAGIKAAAAHAAAAAGPMPAGGSLRDRVDGIRATLDQIGKEVGI